MSARFRRLTLSNWRNFRKVDVLLEQRVFIVGPNASGKTNLLDVFRFLRDIATPGGSLIRALEERRGLKHIRSLHAGGESNVLIEVEVAVGPQDSAEAWTYTLELSGSESRKRQLLIEREVIKQGARIVDSFSAQQETDQRLLAQTHLEVATYNRNFRPLADALAGVTHVHVVPQVARTPARAEEYSRRDAPGSDFIDQLARMPKKKQQAMLKRIERRLRLAVPRFSELKVSRDEVGRPHLEAKYEHWRRRGGWQNEQEFSDGTIRLIGLLWAIETGTEPLLLEEPELSLHRDVIRQVPRLISLAAQRSGRQVIVSTHAEEMLGERGIDPSEILLLEPTEHETKVTLGSAKPELVSAAKAKVPLGRLVTSLTKPKEIDQLSLGLERIA